MFLFYLLLFLIWPFFTFVFALFKCESRIVKMLVVIGFTAVMGANMYYVGVTHDSARYASNFLEDAIYGVDLSDFMSQGRIDILYPLSNVFVGMFTRNPRILFTLYGMLYGLLIYLSLCKIYDIFHVRLVKSQNNDSRLPTIFILIMIYFANPITSMPTFRFFFSVWLFFYGWLAYTDGQNRLGNICMLITPLIHTTFIIPLLIFVVHKYIPIPTKMLFWGVILCFIIGQVLYVQDYMQEISFITESEKYEGYIQDETNEEMMERAERISIVNEMSRILFKYIFFGILLYLCTVVNRIKREDEKSKVVYVYNYILLFFCFAYLFAQVPSMGRFLFLANMLLLFFVGVVYSIGFLPQKRVIFILISLAMLGNIYINIFPKNINIFDLRYLYPIFYL